MAKMHLLDGNHIKEENYKRLESIIMLALEAMENGHNEGMLALEAWSREKLTENLPEYIFMKEAIELYADGVMPDMVEEMLQRKILVLQPESLEGYLCFLIMDALNPKNQELLPYVMEKRLLSCVPNEVKERLGETIFKWQFTISEEAVILNAKKWDKMKPIRTDNPFVRLFEEKIASFDDKKIKRILREILFADLAVILSCTNEDIKEMFSNNLTEKLKSELWQYYLEVPGRKLTESLEDVLSIIGKLETLGEI